MHRALHLYLVHDSGELKVRVVEISPIDTTRANRSNSQLSVFQTSTITQAPREFFIDFFRDSLQLFDLERKPVNDRFKVMCENYTSEVMRIEGLPNTSYRYNEFILTLPSDPKNLFSMLLVLEDTCISLENYVNVLGANYATRLINEPLPEFTKKASIVVGSFSRQPSSQTHAISRSIAQWMTSEYKKDPDILKVYQAAMQNLAVHIENKQPTLTASIRQVLFPISYQDAFIAQKSKENNFLGIMLNPKHSLTAKTSALFTTFRKLIRAEVVPKGRANAKVDRFPTITAFLHALHVSQKQLWGLIVASIFMRPAPDGNTYKEDHGECSLLLNANFHLNAQGLMELDIRHTWAYNEYYVKGKEDHGNLKTELTRACEWLHLYFQPNQNFHENVVFTAESTAVLMSYGFHFTTDYCKALSKELIRAQHTALDIRPLQLLSAIKPIILSQVFPHLRHTDFIEIVESTKPTFTRPQ